MFDFKALNKTHIKHLFLQIRINVGYLGNGGCGEGKKQQENI